MRDCNRGMKKALSHIVERSMATKMINHFYKKIIVRVLIEYALGHCKIVLSFQDNLGANLIY